jgi:hypothetical protein
MTDHTQDAREALRNLATREKEIQQARFASPGMEIGAAFKKWKELRGETAEMLLSDTGGPLKKAMQDLAARLRERPCAKEGCDGSQRLEAICSGCIEGQAGYKTKWTCRKCLHRDLSKETMEEWILKLSSS